MAHTFESVVRAPIADVFGWHSRPGAFRRLQPPWQHVRLVREAESLRDGTAVLALPGGLRWTARHVADEFDPPHRFADALLSTGPVTAWRHLHRFEPVDGDSTRVIDRIDTPAPHRALDAMFGYRHRQLAADLSSHQRLGTDPKHPLTIAVTGSSGLIGSPLTAFLTTGGHRVIRLVRRPARAHDERRWDPEHPSSGLLAGVDVVIHLAGAPIAGRFTEAHKSAIRDSRIGPTRRLAQAAVEATNGPHTLISASAIGWYGPGRGDEVLDEDAAPGHGFLADVVADWEAAAAPAADAGLRVVQIRTGIVQTPAGGTLRLLHPLFWSALGGRISDGSQWTAWIGIDDLADIYLRAATDTTVRGPVNGVAPNPVTNAEYTRTLARVLRRPAAIPVPGFGPRLFLGSEGATELAEAGQRVIPRRLLDAGHRFRYNRLEPALRHLLGRVSADTAAMG